MTTIDLQRETPERPVAATDCCGLNASSDAFVCCGTNTPCPERPGEGRPPATENYQAASPVQPLDSLPRGGERPIHAADGRRAGEGLLPESRRASSTENMVANRGASALSLLLANAADGDSDAWCQITERFTRLVWAVARSYRLGTEDAADVVQTTWLRLVDNLNSIEKPDALPGWLATTAQREALSLLRRRSHEPPLREVDLSAVRPDSWIPECDVSLLERERDVQLWRCVSQLPAKDQRILRILMSCDRPSYAAVAAALDIPVGSIGPTRMRALHRLRRIVESSGYPFEPPA